VAGPINLDVLDPPILEETKFGPNMDRWITNIVDIINASFNTLNQTFANFITAQGVNIGGGGAGPIAVTVTGLTSSGYVNANLISTTNPNVTITSVVPQLNGFAITFSADPGASAIIVYQAFTAQPQ